MPVPVPEVIGLSVMSLVHDALIKESAVTLIVPDAYEAAFASVSKVLLVYEEYVAEEEYAYTFTVIESGNVVKVNETVVPLVKSKRVVPL